MIAGCGRADLIRILASKESANLESAASLLGYQASLSFTDVPETSDKTKPLTEPGPARRLGQVQHAPRPRASEQVLWKPRAAFLQVVRRTYAEHQASTFKMDEVAPWDRDAVKGTAVTPAPNPLVPWPSLWRRLRPLLSREIVSAETDVPRLVRQLSEAEPIHELPRLLQRRFASNIRVFVDRGRRLVPFWHDQDYVCTALDRWTVRHGSHTRLCPDGVEPEFLLNRDPLESLQDGNFDDVLHTASKREDYRGAVVLLLGDLGAYGGPGDRQFWEKTGRLLRDGGADLRALTPCPAWRVDTILKRQWNVMVWDARERDLQSLEPEALSARAEQLLRLVSPSVRVEPALLREARSLLSPGATDSGTEADAWMHPAVVSPSSVALTLDSEKLRTWRKEFLQLPFETKRRLVALLRKVHEDLPCEILNEELLALAEQSTTFPEKTELIEEEEHRSLVDFFVSAAKAFDREHRRGTPIDNAVTDWFRRIEARLPETIWQHPTLGKPLRRAWAVVHREDITSKTPPGLNADDLADLYPPEQRTPRLYRLWQLGNRIKVHPAEAPTQPGPPTPRPGTSKSPQGSAIAEMRIATPRITIAPLNGVGQNFELSSDGVCGMELPDAEEILITSDCEQLHLAHLPKPSWAKRAGRDAYGLFAEFEFQGVTQRMRYITPGRFMMGSPIGERERRDNELQHEVELTEGYWLADTACTQALWRSVMGINPSRFRREEDGKSDERPVEMVSWNDCQDFIEKLNKQIPGLDLRLPTEAEWENACRAGMTTRFSFGENITTEQVNCYGPTPYKGGKEGEYRETTVPVKVLPENQWGLYQMHGNVYEWCEDCYSPYEPGFTENPKGQKKGESRVLRGGSWAGSGGFCRSAYRLKFHPDDRLRNVGFRLSRGWEKEQQGQAGEASERHPAGEGRAGLDAFRIDSKNAQRDEPGKSGRTQSVNDPFAEKKK